MVTNSQKAVPIKHYFRLFFFPEIMKIAVIGTGICRLGVGNLLCRNGEHRYLRGHWRGKKWNALNKGQIPIFWARSGRDFRNEMWSRNACSSPTARQRDWDAKIIMLRCPPPGGDGAADLKYVLGVAEQIGPLLKEYTVIVNKTFVPVAQAELVRKSFQRRHGWIWWVSNPEFYARFGRGRFHETWTRDYRDPISACCQDHGKSVRSVYKTRQSF